MIRTSVGIVIVLPLLIGDRGIELFYNEKSLRLAESLSISAAA